MMSRYVIALCVGLMVTTSGGAQLRQGDPAPAFSAPDIQGREVDLDELLSEEGDPLILFFFDVRSGRGEAPKLREIEQIDQRKFAIVAVGLEDDRETLRRFAEEMDILFHVIADSPDTDLATLYGSIGTLPVTFFISSDRHILRVLYGAGSNLSGLAETLFQQVRGRGDDPAPARSVAEKAIEFQENIQTTRSLLGHLLVAEGRLDEAQAFFQDLGDQEGLARVALERGELDAALELTAASAAGQSAYAETIHGLALMRSGRLDEATAAFERAVTLPASEWQLADAYVALGRLRQEMGAMEEAFRFYDQALALDGYHVDALSNKGAALREQEDIEGASRVMETAKARGVDDSMLALMMGQIQRELEAQRDDRRREYIRDQIRDLVARFREEQAEGVDRTVTETWTTRPLVLAFLPGRLQTRPFFERAGADLIIQEGIVDRFRADARVFDVVEREQLDLLLQELDLGSSDLADARTQHGLGQIFAAQYLGFVEFAQVAQDTTVFVRLVNTETTAIDAQLRRPYRAQTDVTELVTEMADELLATIQSERLLQGLIAEVDNGEVLINLGSAHGVTTGQAFMVLEEGAPIEVGGRIVQRPPREVAQLRVVELSEDAAVCELDATTLRDDVTLAKDMKVWEARPDPGSQ